MAGTLCAANLAASAAVALRAEEPWLALLLPVTFASLHLPYGAGSLWGVLRLAGVFAVDAGRLLYEKPLTRRPTPRPSPSA